MTEAVFVIVGAGQAGAMAAAELRQQGFTGQLILIGAEPHLPYERPPLSKDALLQPDSTRCQIFADTFYPQQAITLKLGVSVQAIDPAAHQLQLSDGSTQAFDKLLLTPGATVRRLPLLDQLGDDVYTLRSLDDAQRLRAALRPGQRVLLVGGGVIGMELASSACELGVHASVIECSPSIMARCAPPLLRDYLTEVHRQRGVAVHLGQPLVAAQRHASGDITLTLADGRQLTGDAVVYGIGVIPDTTLAEQAGLAVAQGIVIDASSRTSHPDIYAAGDACCQIDPASGQHLRRETWESAKNQAVAAAHAMLGLPLPAVDVPWFWTDQCGLNIQFAGDMQAPEWLVRGELAQGQAVLFGLNDGVLTGAITVNQGREMRSARQLIAKQARLPHAVLQDPAQSLRNLARQIE